MILPYYHIDHKGPLEVYKMQTSLFGEPSVLIYNEDKSQIHEEHDPNNVKVLQEFMGKDVEKCYAAGYESEDKKIMLVVKVEEEQYWF